MQVYGMGTSLWLHTTRYDSISCIGSGKSYLFCFGLGAA
jgi:hypothetical protein